MRHTLSSSDPRPSVVGAGLVALDVILTPEHPGKVGIHAGGTCGNVLTILSFLGWEAYPIARLNGDTASNRIRTDFERWGVRLELTHLQPAIETPVIIQKMRYEASGQPRHSFSLVCPQCGTPLPRYQGMHTSCVPQILECVDQPTVFFLDRVSRGTITLARAYADRGSLIVFEPASLGDPLLFREAVAVSHVVKYSKERLEAIDQIDPESMPLLEVQTLGSEGLRFRHTSFVKNSHDWTYLKACPMEQVVDTAGAGDWSTAGFLFALGDRGVEGLRDISIETLTEALQVGQELAAWNCQFLGARGGMYSSYGEIRNSNSTVLLSVQERLNNQTLQNYFDKAETLFPTVCYTCRHRQKADSSGLGQR